MRKTVSFLGTVAATAVLVGLTTFVSEHANGQASPQFVTKMPAGYRDWTVISVAHEAGDLNSLGTKLGNDIAIKAYRERKLPFPDGAIIAAMHWTNSPSDENNKIFGKAQSFVPGAPTNVQFMIKDRKKYAATGGWGFGHFNADGTTGNDVLMKTCYPCHAKAPRDLVFTTYAPAADESIEKK